jgi:HEAT repeat protein
VAWAYRVDRSDTEVLDALLRTVNGDTSVDVRLAAVDALRQFSTNASARLGLAQSLPHQRSPLVQIALIDLLVELQERSATPQLRQLVEEPALDQNVQARAQRALLRLE